MPEAEVDWCKSEAEVEWCELRNAPLPCQNGCKIGTRPQIAPQNAIFLANLNGIDMKTSMLHSGEVEGALTWTKSSLTLFGGTYDMGTTNCLYYIRPFALSSYCRNGISTRTTDVSDPLVLVGSNK
jgi:hypothetical protein